MNPTIYYSPCALCPQGTAIGCLGHQQIIGPVVTFTPGAPGLLRLCDDDVDRIARRVIEMLRNRAP